MRSIRPGPEGDPNEAGHPDTRRRSDLQGDIALNRSVLNLDSLEKGEDIFIGLCAQANRFASLVFDCLCLPAAGYDQVVQIGQAKLCAACVVGSGVRRTWALAERDADTATSTAPVARKKRDTSIVLSSLVEESVQVLIR